MLSTITHELAHVYTLGNSVAETPGPVGIAHVYFHELSVAGTGTFCKPEELYADILMLLLDVVRRGDATYWTQVSRHN